MKKHICKKKRKKKKKSTHYQVKNHIIETLKFSYNHIQLKKIINNPNDWNQKRNSTVFKFGQRNVIRIKKKENSDSFSYVTLYTQVSLNIFWIRRLKHKKKTQIFVKGSYHIPMDAPENSTMNTTKGFSAQREVFEGFH